MKTLFNGIAFIFISICAIIGFFWLIGALAELISTKPILLLPMAILVLIMILNACMNTN